MKSYEGLVTKYIDTANVSTGHEPECCIKIVSADGNKVTQNNNR